MKKLFWLLPLVVFFSCKSAPAPVTEPEPEPVPPVSAAEPKADVAADRSKAVEAMNLAKSVKADVAVKDEFNRALGVFNNAESLAASNSGPSAVEQYREAERLFLDAHKQAVAKRDEAQRQLTLAREAIKSVEDEAAALDQEQQDNALEEGTGE
jgi:superfamily I DNA and RNA helicase